MKLEVRKVYETLTRINKYLFPTVEDFIYRHKHKNYNEPMKAMSKQMFMVLSVKRMWEINQFHGYCVEILGSEHGWIVISDDEERFNVESMFRLVS